MAEIAGSRETLEQTLGIPIDFFCYPGGRHDKASERAVEDAGYRGATTTKPGLARPDQDPFLLDRIRINPGIDVDGLRTQLEAAGVKLPVAS